MLTLAAEHPAAESLERIEQEHTLKDELAPEWAVQPLQLVREEGLPMLVLADPGGDFLDALLGHPLELTEFLRIAIALSAAVARLHAVGLIHKDLKPANVLVAPGRGDVRLLGFGIASRLPRERQAPAPPEVIAGTLAYMAPEQTGRMNRSIDARSDLYALGVTLYEMLTGVLPFTANDPLEWVHCHIARQPVPPHERRKSIPLALSAIIMRLLAKTAEERYQTAKGVEADLRHCQREWETSGAITPFPLGMHDASDRLLVPETLYGREGEIAALVAAFGRVVARGTTELVLVSGYSGIGKSSVVNELHKALVAPRALFAAGKFDQYKRDVPYATLAQAFQGLVRQILGKSDAEVTRWRNALEEALGPNGQLIVNLIPELELIIGKQPPVADLSPQDAQRRFQMLFRRFLGVFARAEHPLALFLDDLQWLDAATLALIEDLATHPEVRYLLLIGAYRDNEVSPAHPLVRTLEAIRTSGVGVQQIVLSPLALRDVGRLVAEALRCERERAFPLAELVHAKTAGNPFFAIQFLSTLVDERLVAFDPASAAWRWDLGQIRAKRFTDNVVDLMVGKLKRLPNVTQEALQQLACLGNVAQTATLTLVQEQSEAEIHTALWEAGRTGLIFRQNGSYMFLHDRVQEAAYALIPEGERAATHLRIGRALASRTAPEEIEENIFEIVNQLDRGATQIEVQEERQRVAELNLIAGRRAKTSTAYAAALNYLATGRQLLAEDSWERCYELTFALEYHSAECELLTANMAAAEERLTALAPHARNLVDRAAIVCLQMTLYTTLDRSDRGVEVCLEYQRNQGVHWSAHPSDDDVRQEYDRIWRLLAGRSIEELVDLPLVNDPEICGTLNVLTEVVTPALFTDKNLLSLVICRMVNLSLEHGNSDGSCFAYVWLGMILGPHFGDYQAGFRFGRLGYELVEKRGLHRYQARAYMSFGNLVMPWTRHIRSGRDLVRRAFDAATKIGDLTFAAYSCNNLNTNLLAAGDPLSEVQQEAEQGLDFARKARFGLVVDIITAQLGLIRTLRGLTPEFGSFHEEGFDESRFEQHLQGDPRLALPECWYWIRRLQACVYANDYSSALRAASNAQQLLWTSPSFFEMAEYHFYAGLARAGRYDAASAKERPQYLDALISHHQQLEAWAENCPENFANRAALLAAEIARIEGRPLDAMSFYEEAIRSAREHGFIQNEGLAHEVAARFYWTRGLETSAHAYLRNARYCYLRWGALGKVRQLEQLYPQLREEEPARGQASTIGAPVEHLDLATVMKVSQAVSGEIILDRLTDTLMRTAIEHAGAQRGLLILLQAGEQRLVAEATTAGDTIGVQLQEAPVAGAMLPESLVNYVARTQENVILDDASAQNPLFPDDPYLREHHARSILCLPLINRGKLIGVLYLENNLTSHVFTPARIAVLKLLASQAAISLENAALYAELRRSEAFLAQGQSISHTGSWSWHLPTGRFVLSEEESRIFGFDAEERLRPTFQLLWERVHSEDRPHLQQTLDRAIQEQSSFTSDFRIVLPDGTTKQLRGMGRPVINEAGEVDEYMGTNMDITASKRAEEALRSAQADLARVARLTMMGELAASIAHEINQPLATIVMDGSTGLNWLSDAKNNVEEARKAFHRIMSEGMRAGNVIRSLRALVKKAGPEVAKFDINAAIEEVLTLARSELMRREVWIHTTPFPQQQWVLGDRVQLQQVLLNLIINANDAMSTVTDRTRMLEIRGQIDASGQALIQVEDNGTGIDAAAAERIFEPFFTTKPAGMGMGLAICRSIIEAHGGRLWASARLPHGTVFQFTVPAADHSADE
ncbi:MAG TPA: AAA family ATPase [Granulicella sp.]|nr:AAA family ATPase [Granulicella sp.]